MGVEQERTSRPSSTFTHSDIAVRDGCGTRENLKVKHVIASVWIDATKHHQGFGDRPYCREGQFGSLLTSSSPSPCTAKQKPEYLVRPAERASGLIKRALRVML
jgi:hypothetical protein